MKTLLVAGTKKGLFVFTSTDRHEWQLHGPFQAGREINHAIYDSRSGRIYRSQRLLFDTITKKTRFVFAG